MENYKVFAIALYLTIVFISGILNSIVYQHISKKALIDQTILDLTYKECLVNIFLMTFSLSVALISCLIANENSLEFIPALLLSNVVFFLICTTSNFLSVSCVLRILTIINNSEEEGLQLLGSDNKAIIKIRILSTGISLFIIIFGNLILNSFPPIWALLLENQNLSTVFVVKKDPGTFIYFISPIIAAVLVISTNLVRQLNILQT